MYLIRSVIFRISLVLFDILHVFSRGFNELQYIEIIYLKFDLLYFEKKIIFDLALLFDNNFVEFVTTFVLLDLMVNSSKQIDLFH